MSKTRNEAKDELSKQVIACNNHFNKCVVCQTLLDNDADVLKCPEYDGMLDKLNTLIEKLQRLSIEESFNQIRD